LKKTCKKKCNDLVCDKAEFDRYDLKEEGCATSIVQIDRKKCKKKCKKACKDECNEQPECPPPPPLVPEDCDDSSQTTPAQCLPLHEGELDDEGKAKFCTDTVDRLCARSCGLCLDGIPRFESCDGDRSPEAACQAGVQAYAGLLNSEGVAYSAEAARSKYCTGFIQKQCPVSCMGASTNEGQCPVARESCADLSTTNSACQASVQAFAEYTAQAAKDKFCTAQIQTECPVTCMGASIGGDQCFDPSSVITRL